MKRAFALLLLAAGCSGQDRDPGTDAALSIRGGTFVRGALPAAAAGPSVEAAFLGQTRFPVAYQGKSFNGTLGASATAVLIELEQDVGYWIVPAGTPFVETPDLPSFDAPLSFSTAAEAGPHVLQLSAVDATGQVGARRFVELTLTSSPLPEGTLTFSLFWDRPSDLDLHVVLPDGVEVYKDEVNSWEPTPGVSEPADAFESGGRLDLDSNGQCRIDGRNSENVTWTRDPPPGKYVVRVDTFSLCDQPSARWTLEARLHGQRVAVTAGQSVPSDTRGLHGRGAGITALELEVP